MNYKKIYNSLIEKRRRCPVNKDRSQPFEVEYHHIIPVACNGKKDPKKKLFNHEGSNLIGLTLKEHFLAHWLLAKIYDGKFKDAMWNAFSHMCGKYSTANKKDFVRCPSHVFVNAKRNAGKYTAQINVGKIAVNNGKISKYVYPNQIPAGFVKGRLVKGKKIYVNNGIETKLVEPDKIPLGFVKGCLCLKKRIWINDGKFEKMINIETDVIPNNWYKGRLNGKDCKWITNGKTNIRTKSSILPIGFYYGKSESR